MGDERKMGDGAGEARAEARFMELEIKLAEMEFGQQQLDEVVLRQSADIRRLNRLVEQLGERLNAALGDDAPAIGRASNERANDAAPDAGLVDPERPPHHSGPA